MSERQRVISTRWAVAALVAVTSLSGCAALSPGEPAAPARGWAGELPGLMPAIRACLESGADDAVGVTKAWPIGESLAGVRVLRDGGERTDCVAVASGETVLLTEPVRQTSRLPEEREPLLTPAGTAPPADRCLDTEAAAGGAWLSYNVCEPAQAGLGPPPRQPARPAPALPPG